MCYFQCTKAITTQDMKEYHRSEIGKLQLSDGTQEIIINEKEAKSTLEGTRGNTDTVHVILEIGKRTMYF